MFMVTEVHYWDPVDITAPDDNTGSWSASLAAVETTEAVRVELTPTGGILHSCAYDFTIIGR